MKDNKKLTHNPIEELEEDTFESKPDAPTDLFSINPTIRLRLRQNIEIAISGLPIDLTQAECKRIKALIDIFTITDSPQLTGVN